MKLESGYFQVWSKEPVQKSSTCAVKIFGLMLTIPVEFFEHGSFFQY